MADWPSGVGRVILDTVDSTNLEVQRRAGDAPLWVLARTQTAGKGRRGRAWAQPGGNFAASLILRPGGAPRDWPLHSFAAALALDDAFAEL
ncbi:MAG: biotin--[acetyl-CoA-carboxylase] ligase, partial [Pseudomonadota bacterium]